MIIGVCQPVWADKCNNLILDNQLDKALVCYQNREDTAEKFLSLGTIYTLKEKYTFALDYFERAYHLNPNNPAIKYSYGVGLINASRNNPVIDIAYKSFDKENDYIQTGKINNTKIYSMSVSKNVSGMIVNF